ncbi:hypothetical protein M409DRAFT_21769 [Zasmidium cellare ATCC 36951]|uniref:NAD dependent epimerase/dehydratase n=1 Tax=Zasmidium cellare ATCC 36951 TaxID=1080233 RepID=A0A6A6CMF4_ZASCE|nr:uncharacterized protein M409DRAFT_21769 [Zasmidium cellare ATCC 36951]KAF2168335.1 hypothetical protein M409DRAFT_21769 [Zasmidium cellare ATCC 36951]
MGLAEYTSCPFVAPKTTWIDKRGKKREVPMRLLCFGLSRTGTASLRMALWELGYNPHHGFAVFENPPDATLSNEAMKAKYEGKGKKWTKEEFDALFCDRDATLDQPGNLFVEELVAAYPDAKVMITVRDVDSWYDSVKKTILDRKPNAAAIFLSIFDPTISLIFSELLRSNTLLYGPKWWTRTREECHEIWAKHLKKVRDVVGEENVFHFNVKDGWEPLCEFLGHEVPRDEDGQVKPFPRVNDAASFDRVMAEYLSKVAVRRLAQGGAFLAAVVAVGFAAYRFRR